MQIASHVPWKRPVWIVAWSIIGIACAPSENESPRVLPPEMQTPPTAGDYEILYNQQNESVVREADSAQEEMNPDEDGEELYSDESIKPVQNNSKKKGDTPFSGTDGVFTMAAIGDSITVGFNAQLPGFNKGLNWSSGNHFLARVKSHFLRLKQIFPGQFRKFNKAKVGSTAADLSKQLDTLKGELNNRELDYLTIMIGANDVCFWPKDHQDHLDRFQDNVRTTVESAVAYNSNLKITVVPVPDMLVLEKVGRQKFCRHAWHLVNMCDSLFFAKSEEERLAFSQRLKDLNHSLEAISQEFPDHVHFASKVGSAVFDASDVSDIDCFHPSDRGQQKIARDAWEGGWYDRLSSDLVVGQ